MSRWKQALRTAFSAAAITAAGCGSDDGSGSSGGAAGQVTDEWRSLCVATFTEDVTLLDVTGDPAFTARAGSEYLLTDFTDWGGEPRVEIAYLTPLGPDKYEVPLTGGPEAFPFTSNCTFGSAVQYYVAFTDVTVYDSETLTNVLCTIPRGSSELRDTSVVGATSAVTFVLNGPQTYQVSLNVYGSRCGGAETGYISVPETHVLGWDTWLIPLTVVMGLP